MSLFNPVLVFDGSQEPSNVHQLVEPFDEFRFVDIAAIGTTCRGAVIHSADKGHIRGIPEKRRFLQDFFQRKIKHFNPLTGNYRLK